MSLSDRNKNLLLEEYFKDICSHFSKLLNELKESCDVWKINLLAKIVFDFSKDYDEYRDIENKKATINS